MGKATKWFRSLLGLKKHPDAPPPSHTAATLPPHPDAKPPKRRWSFVKSYREKGHHNPNKFGVNEDDGTVDPNKHAIAVAAAAAAVAEAAVASAQAAASVLRMTSSGRCTASGSSGNANSNNAGHGSGGGLGNREEWAAVKIQSSFRAYLSRRALKALKALVKLQALVRGNIVRKQASRRIQALLRAQARACAGRSQFSKPPFSTTNSSSLFLHPSPATPEKFDHIAIRAESTRHHDQLLMLKRNGSKSNSRTIIDQDKALEGSWEQRGYSTRTGSTDDEKSDKILEIDTGKSHFTPKHRNLFQSPHHASFTTSAFHQTLSSPSLEAQPFNPLDFTLQIEADNGCTRGPFTPTKSDGSRSGLNGYSDHPNYLTCTESSKAKMRSLSAPKQRVGSQFERTSSTANRYSVYGELKGSSSSSNRQRVYGLNDGFASKAYPGSGRLDRLGMPVGGGDATVGFGGGNWNRY